MLSLDGNLSGDKPSHVLCSFHLQCWRRTAVSSDCSEFPHSFFQFDTLICCSSASISPSISTHLCLPLPLLCWNAYHPVRDGDLIGLSQLVSLIAGNCETSGSHRNSQSQRSRRGRGADGPNDQRGTMRRLQRTSSSSSATNSPCFRCPPERRPVHI